MILGHLIPAGTGFKTFQDSEVRIRPQALEALTTAPERIMVQSFPLLEDVSKEGNGASTPPLPEKPAPTSLDALLGGGGDGAPESEG